MQAYEFSPSWLCKRSRCLCHAGCPVVKQLAWTGSGGAAACYGDVDMGGTGQRVSGNVRMCKSW